MDRKNQPRKLNANSKANFEVFKKNGRTCMAFIDVINDYGLSCQARILLLIISSLSVYEGYAYASNSYFASKLGRSESRVKIYLSELEIVGLIETKMVIHQKYGRGRHIYLQFHIMRRRYLKKDRI
ncbi:hypothetical protein D3C87_148450 [compost metagenome]